MQLIKVRFLNNGAPAGKAYTYYSPVNVSVGDTVQINSAATGVVVEVDVPEGEVEAYKDKIKTIVGLVEKERQRSLDDLDLTVRTYNCLLRHGITTVEELKNMSDEELSKVRNLGQRYIDEIKEKLGGI